MRKFKYQKHLATFKNCPPEAYWEVNTPSFRWVQEQNISASFIPLNLLKEPPPRMLDDSDKMCMGYGLSMFNSFQNALDRYKKLYKKKRSISHEDFLSEKGDSIAELSLNNNDGVYGDLNNNNGHFTFHEYEDCNLDSKISILEKIFDENESFKW